MDHRYPSTAVPPAHPLRLEAWARLHGLGERFGAGLGEAFTYLEIGCGDASNLLPLAARFPGARFVGVDVGEGAIAAGREAAEACGIANLTLSALDLRDFDASSEPFDFVVAHGIYSWIAPDAQARLLAVCRRALAPLGVAYVSYNTMPGWSVRGVVRDAMRHAAQGAGNDTDRLRLARAAVVTLRRDLVSPSHPYTVLLGAEIDAALAKADGYLLSEFLADVNEPVYFREMARRAAEHGLAFMTELVPASIEGELELEMLPRLLASGMSRVEAEQQLDLVAFRQFRATVFCRDDAPVRDEPDFARLAQSGWFAGDLRPAVEEPVLGPGKLLRFRTASGVMIEAERPLLKAALLVLGAAWPAGMRASQIIGAAVDELRERGLLRSVAVTEDDIHATVDDLVELCRRRHAELLPWAPAVVRAIPASPAVHAITRHEAARGGPVTTARHEPLLLDEATRAVLRLLDGTRDVRALVRELATFVDAGVVAIEGLALDRASERDRYGKIAEVVARAVGLIRDVGLLVAEADPAPPARLLVE